MPMNAGGAAVPGAACVPVLSEKFSCEVWGEEEGKNSSTITR